MFLFQQKVNQYNSLNLCVKKFKRKVRKVLRKETQRESVIYIQGQIQFQVQKVKRLCVALST